MPVYETRQKKDNRTAGGPTDGPCPIPPRPPKKSHTNLGPSPALAPLPDAAHNIIPPQAAEGSQAGGHSCSNKE
ncbi:hypothetical protein FRC11_010370 [Ceratobasidium sp. 423]|nr:hypothetical protein FRC11_010370 [Ceratobasidium sp. 423]